MLYRRADVKKFFLISIVVLMLLTSCARSKAAEISESSGVSRYSGISEVVEDGKISGALIYPTYYVRTDTYNSGDESGFSIITLNSREDLEKYTSENEQKYDFATNTHSISFYDTATKYTAEYFEKSSLVLIRLVEESSSYTHGNLGFTETDAGYTLNLIRFTHENDDQSSAVWHIITEVPKNSPVLEAAIKVDITEEKAD